MSPAYASANFPPHCTAARDAFRDTVPCAIRQRLRVAPEAPPRRPGEGPEAAPALPARPVKKEAGDDRDTRSPLDIKVPARTESDTLAPITPNAPEQDSQMTTNSNLLRRALAVAAFLVLAAPACVAAENASVPAADLAQARTLYDAGRYGEALAALRPLTEGPAVDAEAVFLLGLAAIEASRRLPADAVAQRKALLDEAIAALHGMLVERPGLVRVRLELGRAFFYKEEDGLARDHFERVLAGDPPPAVATNVRRFLLQMRARRRWSTYLGLSVAPDTNIGAASDEDFKQPGIIQPAFGSFREIGDPSIRHMHVGDAQAPDSRRVEKSYGVRVLGPDGMDVVHGLGEARRVGTAGSI